MPGDNREGKALKTDNSGRLVRSRACPNERYFFLGAFFPPFFFLPEPFFAFEALADFLGAAFLVVFFAFFAFLAVFLAFFGAALTAALTAAFLTAFFFAGLGFFVVFLAGAALAGAAAGAGLAGAAFAVAFFTGRRGMGSCYFVVVFVIGSKFRDFYLNIEVVVLISKVIGVVVTGEAIAVKHYSGLL